MALENLLRDQRDELLLLRRLQAARSCSHGKSHACVKVYGPDGYGILRQFGPYGSSEAQVGPCKYFLQLPLIKVERQGVHLSIVARVDGGRIIAAAENRNGEQVEVVEEQIRSRRYPVL